MNMEHFAPLGEVARWRTIYDMIAAKPVDAVITYDELGMALDLDPKTDRGVIQVAMRRAAKQSETQDHRALESVTNVGYRIVHAEEHLRLAKHQQQRASRALKRGHSKVVNVDFNGMDPEVRKAFDVVAVAFSMQTDFMRRLDVRQSHLEKIVRGVGKKQERSEAEIQELRERLERLEKPND